MRSLTRSCLCWLLALSIHAEPSEKSLRYHQLLLKKPQPGTVLDRFVDAWLENDSPAALTNFLKAKAASPEATPNDHLLLALHLAQEATDDTAALAAFEKATTAAPENAIAWQHKARLESRMLDFPRALASLEAALAQHPEPKMALELSKQRGRTLLRLGRTKDALDAWSALLKEHSGDEDLADELVDLQVEEGLEAEAVSQLTALIGITKDPYNRAVRRLRLGDILLRQVKKTEALTAYGEALAQSAAGSWIESEALARVDSTFRRDDNLKGLAEHLGALVKSHPQRLGVLKARAQVLAESGDKEGAMAIYQDILQRSPGQRDLREAYLDMLEKMERYADAIAQTKLLIEQSKTDKELQLRLATLHHKAADKAASVAALDAFLAMPGVDEFDHLRVANMLDNWKRTDEAKQRFAAAIAKYPKSFEVRDAHAQFLHRSGDKAAALQVWSELAKGVGRDELLAIGIALIARGEHKTALDLLSARVAEFGHEPQFLAPLCQAALATKQAKVAIPWALARVRLSDESTGLPDALKQAETILRDAEAIATTIQDLKALPKPTVSDQCLLSALLESQGDLQGAEAALQSSGSTPDATNHALQSQLIRLYQGRQEFAKAAEVLAKVLTKPDGRTAQNAQRRVDMLNRGGDSEAAIKAVALWKQLAPSSSQPFLAESKFLRTLGKSEEALTLLRAAARKFEDDESVASALADTYAEAGQYASCERIYLKLYERAEDETGKLRSVKLLAEAALSRGETEGLTARFRERQKNNRADPVLWLAIATILEVANKEAEQLAALIEAARLKPTDVQLAHQIARMQEEQGQVAQARLTLERIASTDTSTRTRTLMALMAVRNGDAEKGYEALAQLAGGSTIDARDAEIIADTMAANGDWERLVTFVQPLVVKLPDDYRLGYQLAVAFEENNDREAALREFTRVAFIKTELPGFPKVKSGGTPWYQQAYDSYPPGAMDCMRLSNDLYQAYQHRRQRSMSQMTKGGFLSLAGNVEDGRVLALAHLYRLATEMGDAEREKLGDTMREAGMGAWPAIAFGTQQQDWGGIEVSSAVLDRWPEDVVLNALWSGENDGSEENMKRFRRCFEVLKKDYPGLAMDKAFAALAANPEGARSLLQDSVQIVGRVQKVGSMNMWRLARTLGGSQNIDRDEGLPLDLPADLAVTAMKLFRQLHEQMQLDNEMRAYTGIYLTHALAKKEMWAELIEFFETESARYFASPAGMKVSKNSFGRYQGTSRGQPMMMFPSPGHFPPHIAGLMAFPDPFNPDSYGPMKQRREGKRLLDLVDQIKDPHLRVFMAWWGGDGKRAQSLADALVAKADAKASDYMLAAGLASRMEQPERALGLLAKSASLPMQVDERQVVDAGFMAVIAEISKVPEADLEPARQAVRRLRASRSPQLAELPGLMEKLAMKEEAERLSKQLAAAPTTTSPRYNYSNTAQQESNKRIAGHVAKGNLDAAARELLSQMGNMMSNYLGGNLSYPIGSGPSIVREHSAVAKHALANLEKAATSSSKRLELAIWADIFGEKEKAREQFAKVLEQQPKNATAYARLIALTLVKDREAGAALFEKAPLEMVGGILNSGLLESCLQLDITLEQRCALLAGATRRLNKLAAEKAMLQKAAISGLGMLPALARYPSERSSRQLKEYLNEREPGRDSKANETLVKLRRDTHDALCRTMLKFPALADLAFASLTCTQDEAWLLKTAREVLETPPATEPRAPVIGIVRWGGDSQGYLRRWLPGPAEYLIAHAASHGKVDTIEKELLPLAEKHLRSNELRVVRAYATLWTCPEQDFPRALRDWSRVTADPNNYYWACSAEACVPVDVWAQRKLSISLDEAVAETVRTLTNWAVPALLVRYMQLRYQENPAQALASMETIVARMIGSGDARARRVKGYMDSRYGPGGSTDQAVGLIQAALEAMVRYTLTVGFAFEASTQLGLASDPRWLENLNNYVDEDALHSNAATFVSMLRARSCLKEAKDFDPQHSDRSRSTMGRLFNISEDKSAFREELIALLGKEPVATFGAELCIALAAPSKDRAGAVTNWIKKRAADFASVPEARRMGLGNLLRWAVPGLKTPGTMDPAVTKPLEPIIGSLIKEQVANTDKMLAAKTFQDLGLSRSASDHELKTELPGMLAELARTDKDKARALFEKVLSLTEVRQAKEGLYGSPYAGGWTVRSAVMHSLVENQKGMEVAGFAARMFAEDTSGNLIASLETPQKNTGAALHEFFRNNGGQGNLGRGLMAMFKRLEQQLGDASPAALLYSLHEFSGRLGTSQWIPAIRWCAQKQHPYAAELDAVLRLHLTTHQDTRKNAAMLKSLEELGGVAPMWQHYRSIILNDKLTPQLRLGIATRVLRDRWHDADADLVRTASALIAQENKAFHACVGSQQMRYILRSFVRLPKDEAWQATLKDLWESWLVRNARNGEDSRLGRAYDPDDENIQGMMLAAAAGGKTEWCEKLVNECEKSLDNEPSAIITLVEGGQVALAAKLMERWGLGMIYDPNEGQMWNALIDQNMPAFVAACSKPEWGVFGEILLNNRLKDPGTPDAGVKSRKDRFLALVPKLKTTTFTDSALRQRCLEFCAQINELAEPLAADYAEALKSLDVEKAMSMGTWESFLYTGPASAALANELWKGNAQPALDLLPKAVAAVKGDPNQNNNPWWTVGYIFGAPIFDTNWRWEQGHTFDTSALVKFYEAMAVQMPQPPNQTGVQSAHMVGRVVSLLMVIRAVQGDMAPFQAWRKSLTEEQRKTVQRSFKARHNLLQECASYFGKAKTKFPLEQRAKAMALVLKDPWVAPLFPDAGANLPNISGVLVNQTKAFTPAEFGRVALQLAEVLPRKGKTAGEAADVLVQQGKLADALPLFDLAAKQGLPDVNVHAAFLFRKVETLERMNKKDEARAALGAVVKGKLGVNNQKTLESMLKRLGP